MGVAGELTLDVRNTAESLVRGTETVVQGTIVLARIFDAIPVGVIVIDSKGKIALVNTEVERMFGSPRDNLIGDDVERLIPSRHRQAHATYRREYAAAAQTRPMGAGRDLYGRRDDGSEFPIEIGLKPIALTGGTGVIATIVDITRRKKLELDLRRANESLEGFALAASRDLKAPLHGMARLADSLVANLTDVDRPDARVNADRIVEHVARLERMIEDLSVSATRASPAPPTEPATQPEPVA
jgi:PAS domain S-box-containing protein